MLDEAKLLAGLKAGRTAYLAEAIKRYTPYINVVVYNAAKGLISREDVEEIAADSFVQLWRTADKLDEAKGSIRAYLAVIARNLTLNRLRGRKPTAEIPFDLADGQPQPEERLLAKEGETRLYREILTLGEPDAEIFLRFYCYDEKIRYIAAVLAMPPATVKTKLRRARLKLAERLKNDELLCEQSLKGGMANE